MNLKEAIEKYKPDLMSAGLKRDGSLEEALRNEVVRYYFKGGCEVFYYIVGFSSCIKVTEIARSWDKKIKDAYYIIPVVEE